MERDGQPVELPRSRKTRALLAYLLLNPREHRRSNLASLLWADVADPRGSLRWSLQRLRQVLGDALQTDRDTVAVVARDLDVDVLQARELAEDAPAEALEQGLAGFRGELLAEDELPDVPGFHAWCTAEREELRRLEATLLRRLLDRLDDDERAVRWARRLHERERSEDSCARLVALLARTGRHEEADAHYRTFETWLRDAGQRPSLALLHLRAGGPAPRPGPAPSQVVQLCTARDGTRIAYAVSGEGSPLVKTANWLNHLEHDWESPIWRPWLSELSRHHQVVRYDERGNGLSQRGVPDLSLEAFVADLEAVVDVVGLERFPLLGISQGCAVAVAFAARHPERVSHLVLIGGFVRGWRARGVRREMDLAEALLTLARVGWGQHHAAFRQSFTSMFFPGATAEQMQAFNELQRRTATPDDAVRLIRAIGELDVSGIAPEVRVPSLVLHSRRDAVIPYEEGLALAAAIPKARFVTLESDNHLMLAGEPAFDVLQTELRAFLRS